MNFIVATKRTVSLLDKKGQLMHDGVRSFVLVGIPEHGEVFCIFMIGIAWKNFIGLVGRMYIKDENSIFIKGIIDFLKNISYFHFILHVADRIRVTRDKIILTCLGQIQHIAFNKVNLLLCRSRSLFSNLQHTRTQIKPSHFKTSLREAHRLNSSPTSQFQEFLSLLSLG